MRYAIYFAHEAISNPIVCQSAALAQDEAPQGRAAGATSRPINARTFASLRRAKSPR